MPDRRWGLSLDAVPLAQLEPMVRAAEAAGYTDGWPGEVSLWDGFTPIAAAAVWTERMRLGTGVVNVFTRGPAGLSPHAAPLQEPSGGRLCPGVRSPSD